MVAKLPLFQLSLSGIITNNVPVRWFPPHRYTGPGNAEGIEGEEGFFLGSTLLVRDLEVVIQHHLRHDEFDHDGCVEAPRTGLT